MQKRYAQLADRLERSERDDAPPEPSRGTAEYVAYTGTKTFHLSRRFEYRREDRPADSPLMGVDELSDLGAEGWELAGIVSDATGTHYFLKRGRGSAATG